MPKRTLQKYVFVTSAHTINEVPETPLPKKLLQHTPITGWRRGPTSSGSRNIYSYVVAISREGRTLVHKQVTQPLPVRSGAQ